MRLRQEHIKKALLGIILAFLALPFFQQQIPLFSPEPLKGAIESHQKPVLSDTGWWNGSFQQSYELWYNDSFGFRSTTIRLHNQIGYWLYRKAYANSVKIGKEGYLFENNYMAAYSGDDYLGEDSIRHLLEKARFVQEALKENGITLLLVFAPGKGSYYHEFLPDEYARVKGPTNSATYVKVSQELGLNYIDAKSWFMRMKPVSKYPLFPKYGIHWSRYGALLAADSIQKKIGQLRGTRLPGFVIKKVYFSKDVQDPDFDVGESMNLLFPPAPPEMAYADYEIEKREGKELVRQLTIADSYYWTFPLHLMSDSAAKQIDFFYYNQQLFPRNRGDNMKMADQVDYAELIMSHNVIMILATDGNLRNFSWGFIDKAYDILKNNPGPSYSRHSPKVEKSMNYILRSHDWLNQLDAEAKSKGITLDSLVYRDAVDIVKTAWRIELPGSSYRRASKAERQQMDIIFSDPNWYPMELRKAREAGIPADSMILLDTRIILKQGSR